MGRNIHHSVDTCFMKRQCSIKHRFAWVATSRETSKYYSIACEFPFTEFINNTKCLPIIYLCMPTVYYSLLWQLALLPMKCQKTERTTLLPRWLNTTCFPICTSVHMAKASPLPHHRRRCSTGTGDNYEVIEVSAYNVIRTSLKTSQ